HHNNSTRKDKQSLRKAKSTPKLFSSNTTATTTPTTTTATTKSRKRQQNSSSSSFSGFFKKISSIFSKIKSISDDVLNIDDLDLFVDPSDLSSAMTTAVPSNNPSSVEETFLQSYKKYKSLDLVAEHYQKNVINNNKSASNNAHHNTQTLSITLQDFMKKQQSTFMTTGNTQTNHGLPTTAFVPQTNPHDDIIIDDEFELSDDESTVENPDEIVYNDIDIIELRKEFETWVNNTNTLSDSDSKSTLLSSTNIGTNLWEYRRSKWLNNTNPISISNNEEKLKKRLRETSISYIPKESYIKIYSSLIDKNKVLRNDKHINLSDLIKIMNIGWIAEDKWERAARGLP
ncbi:hypothetical protein G210_2082, partial [Candida maltosa Xu316]